MSSFVHTSYPLQHPGVVRFEQAGATLRAGLRGGRGSAALLLAAVVAALLVVATQVVQSWTDGHLLAAWIALWAVAFAGLALLAAPTRRAAAGVRSRVAAWKEARRQAEADRQIWALAQTDARVMADISRAMSAAARDLGRMY
ncbi:hypothetical protein [Xylophilus sp.]|uniref:hypothetical protein n=1 Tax=Xylophilus sp. TaxID=2653893 RepID=UPI0013B90978|nr:hypothetical protein [Xylophilus sp.]KAF1050093.1 MAG: hypothetical protein GAK38_00118 [Xylophilus sp.]